MHLAFVLFKYFPHGGLQRNFRRITELALERGHQVDVFTLAWEGWTPEHPQLKLHVLRVPGWRNHTRYRHFARRVQSEVQALQPDRVVGFNKLPGLDVYYNADPCFIERAQARSRFYRLSGRCRVHAALERAVFRTEANNRILLLSEAEKPLFQRWYATPEDRFHLMPPYVSADRFANADTPQRRRALRKELGLGNDSLMLLMVGSDFRRKGVDRSIRALAALPDGLRERASLYVLGKGRAAPLMRLARRLGIAGQVHFLQGRDDVADFLFAADLLLHPAYQENTGTAIVEAIAAGLPALVTANCGYAFHVERAGCGEVLTTPFEQPMMDAALARMLSQPKLQAWRDAALCYSERTELGARAEHALRVIEAPRYGETAA